MIDTKVMKPLPVPTPTTQPYWDGLQDGRLMLQFSPSAAEWIFYPRVLAPKTLADDLEWRQASGYGTVYTYTVVHYPTHPAWSGDLPQLLAVVELDEGPRMTTELVNVDPATIHVGMRVKPVFCDEPDAGVTILRFEPESNSTA